MLIFVRFVVGTVLTGSLNDNRNNKSVNTKHTRHDNGDDVLHHQTGVHHTHGGNTYTCLGSSVGGTDI